MKHEDFQKDAIKIEEIVSRLPSETEKLCHESHTKAICYCKGKKQYQGEEINSELYYLPDTYVKSVSVQHWIEKNSVYMYVLSVTGRSRFLNCLPERHKYITYKAYARYSSLLDFHQEIESILKPYIGIKIKAEIPHFPHKKWLRNDDDLASKRVKKLNFYFSELLNRFGKYLSYNEHFINRFSPIEIEINFAGWDSPNTNYLINLLCVMSKNMDITEHEIVPTSTNHPEQYCTHCTISKKSNYSDIIEQFVKKEKITKKLWENMAPFDYFTDGHLYRITIKHSHKTAGETNSNINYLGPTVYLVDGISEETCIENLQSSLLNPKIKTKPKFFIVAIINPKPELIPKLRKSCLSAIEYTTGEKDANKVIEVDLSNGNGMFKILDNLIMQKFCCKSPACTAGLP